MGIPSMESGRELHQNLDTTHVSLHHWDFQELKTNILSAGTGVYSVFITTLAPEFLSPTEILRLLCRA